MHEILLHNTELQYVTLVSEGDGGRVVSITSEMRTRMMPGHTSRQWRRCGINVAVLGCRNTSCSMNLHDCPGDGERERGREE